jgi:hypothetical protein
MEAAFRRAEEKERREIKEADEHREPNPWLCRVGWAAHLAGLDRAEIRGWEEMPDNDEPGLQTVCKAFDWMIREAQYITMQEVVGQAALFEVHRKEVTEEAQCHLTVGWTSLRFAVIRMYGDSCCVMCFVRRERSARTGQHID